MSAPVAASIRLVGPTREEWEIWRENPVTAFVMAGVERVAVTAEATWKEAAFIRPPTLTDVELRGIENERQRVKVRAETYAELANLTFDDAYGANGMEIPTDDG